VLYNSLQHGLSPPGLADGFGHSELPLLVINVTYPLVPDQIIDFCVTKRAVMVLPGQANEFDPPMRILGIDPGLQRTGFGVIEIEGSRLQYVASGTISTLELARGNLPGRIKLIYEGVAEVKRRYQPQAASVEIVFVNVNPQSTLLLGQARGAALAALVSDEMPVAEYTALQMKKAVVGHGLASKNQIQEMVMRLLKLPGLPGKDAADALGLAITHAHAARSFEALAGANTPRSHAQFKAGRSY
jgi:crossover junction endodeoxyribonuclease RuvC